MEQQRSGSYVESHNYGTHFLKQLILFGRSPVSFMEGQQVSLSFTVYSVPLVAFNSDSWGGLHQSLLI